MAQCERVHSAACVDPGQGIPLSKDRPAFLGMLGLSHFLPFRETAINQSWDLFRHEFAGWIGWDPNAQAEDAFLLLNFFATEKSGRQQEGSNESSKHLQLGQAEGLFI